MKTITGFMFVAVVLHLAPAAAHAESVRLARATRPVTAVEVAGGAPAGGLVHEFFVTAGSDLLAIMEVGVTAPLFQHTMGGDLAPPLAGAATFAPALTADSFITLPGDTLTLGGGFSGIHGQQLWGDLSNDGPQQDFLFARLTTVGETGKFSGTVAVRGYAEFVPLSFEFLLPGNDADLARLADEPVYSLEYSLDPPVPSEPPTLPPIVETPPTTPGPVNSDPPTLPPVVETPPIGQKPPVDPHEPHPGAPEPPDVGQLEVLVIVISDPSVPPVVETRPVGDPPDREFDPRVDPSETTLPTEPQVPVILVGEAGEQPVLGYPIDCWNGRPWISYATDVIDFDPLVDIHFNPVVDIEHDWGGGPFVIPNSKLFPSELLLHSGLLPSGLAVMHDGAATDMVPHALGAAAGAGGAAELAVPEPSATALAALALAAAGALARKRACSS